MRFRSFLLPFLLLLLLLRLLLLYKRTEKIRKALIAAAKKEHIFGVDGRAAGMPERGVNFDITNGTRATNTLRRILGHG